MSHIRTVLVTGASGFTGSAIVDKILAAGYTARGTVRSAKVDRVKSAYAPFGDRFEVATVDDIVTSDLTDAFKGVDALIHAGSPLNPPGPTDVVIRNAVDGTNNILNNAFKAGVKKIVFTSSLITIADVPDMMSGKTFTGKDWNEQTVEDALEVDAPMWAPYGALKTASEKALWKFATEHPEVDVATIHPSFLYGPAGRGQVLDGPVAGTNSYIYQLIAGEKGRPVPDQMSAGHFTDVRDAALAHVLALKAPPAEEPKRIIVVSGDFTWREAVAYLHAARPDLKDRLPALAVGDIPAASNWCRWDTSSAEKVLGVKEYKDWRATLTETIDDIIAREKKLASQ